MATINVRRDVTDPFYRYKMEKLQSKIEGKGNGIKSVITNLSSVAGSLSRPPLYVVKFFGFELGAQTNTGDHDRWIINGAHEASKLQDYLDTFIAKFVLCKECQNPETDLTIGKDQSIIRNCKACGRRTPVDPRHKLSSWILKNTPKKDKKTKSDKKKKTAGDENAKDASHSEEEVENANGNVTNATSNLEQYAGEAGSDDEFTRRIQAEASALPTADGSEDKKDDWSVDVSEEAVKRRAKDLPTDLKKALVINNEDDDDDADGDGGDNPYDHFATWFEVELSKGGKVESIDIYKKLQDLGIEKKHRTPQVLAQTLFDENIAKEIGDRKEMLKTLITSERHERAFLGGVERLVGIAHPKLLGSVPTILHQIYENDVVSEEAIQKWGSKPSKKYVDLATSKKVRKAAEPFLKWLEEAEDESEDEDDDEDE